MPLEGLLAIILSLSSAAQKVWSTLLLEGLTSVVMGIFIFGARWHWECAIGISAIMALAMIAFWAIVTGIFETVAAIRLPKEIAEKWELGLSGVTSILFGGLIFVLRPSEGVLAITSLIGAYGLIFGSLLIFLGIKARRND